MLKSGDIVHGVVSQVEEFGIYLESNGDRILVTLPYLSWTKRVKSGNEFAMVGAEFDVRVGTFVELENVWRGSIRDAYPDDDPWTHANWLSEGRERAGVVYTIIRRKEPSVRPFGYAIELSPGIETVLIDDGTHPVYQVGDQLKLVLSNIDPNRRTLEVRLADT
jgi:ribosomal protein S1